MDYGQKTTKRVTFFLWDSSNFETDILKDNIVMMIAEWANKKWNEAFG